MFGPVDDSTSKRSFGVEARNDEACTRGNAATERTACGFVRIAVAVFLERIVSPTGSLDLSAKRSNSRTHSLMQTMKYQLHEITFGRQCNSNSGISLCLFFDQDFVILTSAPLLCCSISGSFEPHSRRYQLAWAIRRRVQQGTSNFVVRAVICGSCDSVTARGRKAGRKARTGSHKQ